MSWSTTFPWHHDHDRARGGSSLRFGLADAADPGAKLRVGNG